MSMFFFIYAFAITHWVTLPPYFQDPHYRAPAPITTQPIPTRKP